MWIPGHTATNALYSISWLVFVTEMESVYCAVRTGYLYLIQVDPGLPGVNVCTFDAQWVPFPRQCLSETKGPLMNTAIWIGLLVICHVLWSSVYMSYCSALSRTPPALNTWRPIPVQHATYWFHTELVSSTKKSQICKHVAVFRVDASLNRSLECASGCRHWRERVKKPPCNAATDPMQPSNS